MITSGDFLKVKKPDNNCPCQSSLDYKNCCGKYHNGKIPAPTAEALMRSRYTAYVMGNAQYLFKTWHKSTRPTLKALKSFGAQNLIGLKIIATQAGGESDNKGMVEFIATSHSPTLVGIFDQHKEKSLFARVNNRWVYIDAI